MNLETKITIYKFTPQVFTLPLKKIWLGWGGKKALLVFLLFFLLFPEIFWVGGWGFGGWGKGGGGVEGGVFLYGTASLTVGTGHTGRILFVIPQVFYPDGFASL